MIALSLLAGGPLEPMVQDPERAELLCVVAGGVGGKNLGCGPGSREGGKRRGFWVRR